MRTEPGSAIRGGQRVVKAGGRFALRKSYRRAWMRSLEKARAAGASQADLDRARRRAVRVEERCADIWRNQEVSYRSAVTITPVNGQRQEPQPRVTSVEVV